MVSRWVNVYKKTVSAPTSMAKEPKPSKCAEMRANSQHITRMYWQRGGSALAG